jgi:hypothetical protein
VLCRASSAETDTLARQEPARPATGPNHCCCWPTAPIETPRTTTVNLLLSITHEQHAIAGAALFDLFAHDPDSILAVLRETTATMLARAQRLRGTTRCHRPSRAEPHIVLLVDELTTLTAYDDRKQRAEVDNSSGSGWPKAAQSASVSSPPCKTPPKTWWYCANCSRSGSGCA